MWQLAPIAQEEIGQLGREIEVPSPALLRYFLRRGLRSRQTIEHFLHPSLKHLHDPFLLPDLDKAVRLLLTHLHRDHFIAVVGDYDVDGLTSLALIGDLLDKVGAKYEIYIPDRHREGYGLSREAVHWAYRQGARLLIAVDIGSKDTDALLLARQLGITTIVLDHHEVPMPWPPADALVNPHRPDSRYPFPTISAAVVVLKFIQAVHQRLNRPFQPGEWLDLVALSILADVMPLLDENRALVVAGLKQMEQQLRPGLKALMQTMGLTNSTTSWQTRDARDLMFRLAPALNAAGRIAHAREGLYLLRATSDTEAQYWAEKLQNLNQMRRQLTESVFRAALQQAQQYSQDEILILTGNDWHEGVVGIVAARLVERLHKPVIVLTEVAPGIYKGSGRSPDYYNLYELLLPHAHLFARFGGHAQAVGLTIPAEHIPILRRLMNQTQIHENSVAKPLIVDAPLGLDEITPQFMDWLERTAPWGEGNPTPLFVSQEVREVGKSYVFKERHLKLVVADRTGAQQYVTLWNQGDRLAEYHLRKMDIVYTLRRRYYQDRAYIDLYGELIHLHE